MPTLSSTRRPHGFTLIELMIVVVIVGLLAAIAYPSYQQYVRKSTRTAAQGFMLSIAAKQEQYLIDARAYAATIGALNMTAPPETNGKYTFAVAAAATPPTFTVTATAIGTQVSDVGAVVLTLTSAGAKTPPDKW